MIYEKLAGLFKHRSFQLKFKFLYVLEIDFEVLLLLSFQPTKFY